jgi:hypothetical protein
MASSKVLITQYKWAGSWGPFKVKVKCNECDLTTAILRALLKKEFKKKPVELVIKPWLDNWYKIIWRGAWHAPIVFVGRKMIVQGKTVNRDDVREEVLRQLKK